MSLLQLFQRLLFSPVTAGEMRRLGWRHVSVSLCRECGGVAEMEWMAQRESKRRRSKADDWVHSETRSAPPRTADDIVPEENERGEEGKEELADCAETQSAPGGRMEGSQGRTEERERSEDEEPDTRLVRLVRVDGKCTKFGDAPRFMQRRRDAGGIVGGLCAAGLRVWDGMMWLLRWVILCAYFVVTLITMFVGFCCCLQCCGCFEQMIAEEYVNGMRRVMEVMDKRRTFVFALLVLCVFDFLSDILVGIDLLVDLPFLGVSILLLSSADVVNVFLTMVNVSEGGEAPRWVSRASFFFGLTEVVIFGLTLWASFLRGSEPDMSGWKFVFSLTTTVLAAAFKGILALLAPSHPNGVGGGGDKKTEQGGGEIQKKEPLSDCEAGQTAVSREPTSLSVVPGPVEGAD